MVDTGFKLFISQGESGSCEPPSYSLSLGRSVVYAEDVSQSFLPILVWLLSSSPYTQLSSFLDFFQKELLHRWLYIHCVHGRRWAQRPLMSSSLYGNRFFKSRHNSGTCLASSLLTLHKWPSLLLNLITTKLNSKIWYAKGVIFLFHLKKCEIYIHTDF